MHHSSTIIILLYSTVLLLLICNGGKSMENVPLKDDENVNQFMDLVVPHFEQFGKPFEPLELEKDHIIKKNLKTGKVEWRLAEIKRNWRIKIDEYSMLDEIDNEKKVLAQTMTEYANCVKNEKLKIPKDKETKIFMLNGTITIPEMKRIAGKGHAYLAEFVAKLSGYGQQQKMETVPTHFCTSLMIAKNGEKIGEHELVCTRIDRWNEKYTPPKNIGQMKDCGYSELYDSKLDEYFAKSEALEFVQIKLAIDLSKMLKRFVEATNLIERKKHKKDDKHNMPTASIISVDEYQIEKMDPNLRIYTGFMVEYDPRKLVSHWLLERLTTENTLSKNQIKRPNLIWNTDPKLPTIFQPDERDYQTAKQFKLNHGHLAGYRAHKINDVHETFLYPNSVPQDREINSGYWRVIEEYALCLAGHKKSIAYVYTGPLYIPKKSENTDEWLMKYKVIGKRKMMAVPTHLFKIIFLEFINDNEKKSFWLETFVVSNGQEGEVEVVEEENVDLIKEENVLKGGQEEEAVEEEEEEEDFIVELGEGNNVYYILSKDEAEINELLKKNSDKGKEKATTSAESGVSIKKTGQKSDVRKGKIIPEVKVYLIKKNDNIQALVRDCQNRQYKINYWDEKKRPISDLLEEHRKPLTYIDKFAPNFQLLTKLPAQLRAGKKGSERKGVHFDEDIMAKLIEENEKRKDKGKRKKLDKGKRKRKDKSIRKQLFSPIKDIVEESGNSSNDEKEEKRKGEEGGEGDVEAKSHREKPAAAGGAKGKRGKNINKGGKTNNKQQSQQQKQRHQQSAITAANFDVSSSTENAAETKFYEVMEKLYKGYLLNTELKNNEERFLFDSIILQTSWHEIQSLLQSVKEKMLVDGNTIGADQIDAIRLELYKNKEIEDLLRIHETVDLLYLIKVEEANLSDEGYICWLTHLRESIFYTYLSHSSRQKGNHLRNFALEFEQKWWREFSILPEAKGEQEYSFSNNVDGKIIAQIWMEKANWCYDENQDRNKYVYKYKLERQDLLFSTLQKLLKEKEFAKKLKQFLDRNDNESKTRYNSKLMHILGVNLSKKFFQEFSNLMEIAPQNLPEFSVTAFLYANFDVILFSGYKRRKYMLQEFLYFFDYHAIMEKIDEFYYSYSNEIRKFKDKSDKRTVIGELSDIKELKKQLSKCPNLENNNKISASMGQALVIRCIRDVYCQWQNLYYKVNFVPLDLRKKEVEGKNVHYFGGEECDRLIRMHGTMFTKTFENYPNESKKFYKQFTEDYDDTTRSLINWSFNLEMKTDENGNIANLKVDDISPIYEKAFRQTKLEINDQSETYVESWRPYLLEHNLVDWQTIQSRVACSVAKASITLLFRALQSPSNKMFKMTQKDQALDALNAFQNDQKISTLQEMFKQIVEKIKKGKIKPLQDLCQLFVLRQHLHFLIEKMGVEQQEKNNSELQELIEKYGEIHKSNVPFDEEVAGGMLITIDGLDGYCQDDERREKLYRKHRQEIENMVAHQLYRIFFTHAFGSMTNYYTVVDLPAKLIKIAGVSGFTKIAKYHPLLMTNFFNMETVHAILFNLENVVEEKVKQQQQNLENIENVDEERKKYHIMLDSILLQLKLQNTQILEISAAGKQENLLSNDELEKRNKIERVRAEGMDILMEWLDTSNVEKTNKMRVMTKEEKEKQNELDEIAYSAIGQLIIGSEEYKVSGLEEIDTRESINSAAARMQVENWRKQWRDSTLLKLNKLELDGKESSKKKIEEEK